MDFEKPLETFRSNLDSVSKLVNFDKEVQELAIQGIDELHLMLKNAQHITNPKLNGERTLQILRGLRQSPALERRYSLIFNQAVVLLVSYFASALGDIFRIAAAAALSRSDDRVLEVELKVRVNEMLELAESADQVIGDLLILKEDISFQDMQSAHRAFKKYFGVNLQTDDVVRNIIVSQACRHAIVHDGARANSRIMNQIRNAKPRSLKPDLALGQEIKFSIEELEQLSTDMLQYVSTLTELVKGVK